MIDEKAFDNYECEGQMSFDDLYPQEPESTLIAVSKIFARAMKEMSLSEWKTFVYALTRIKWTEKNRAEIYLDKKKLADLVGVKSDSDHLSRNLDRSIGGLPGHSYIKIAKEDKERYAAVNGNMVRICEINANPQVFVLLEEHFLPMFQELNKAQEGYITMWSGDLFSMASERSIIFYEDLRLHSDTRTTNTRIYTTKDLKELFNIPRDGRGSYMQKNGRFNRTNFEQKVLVPIVEDLQKCKMINLILEDDGMPWRKEKRGNRVVGYRFTWTISQHPGVASAKEVKELQERVDKNPKVLKVAKDLVSGEKKSPKKKQTDLKKYNNFGQRKYDYAELERQLANSPNN